MGILKKLKKNIFKEHATTDEGLKIDQTSEVKDENDVSQESAKPVLQMNINKQGKYTNAHKVLVQARVSEKAAHLVQENKYVFLVQGNANKQEIKKAIKHVYNVKPLKVNIINTQGKKVGYRFRSGKRSDYKKAVVTLAKNDTISIYEGV